LGSRRHRFNQAIAFLLLGEPVRTFHLAGIALILLDFATAVVQRPRSAR
jgi:hypothetical protein